MNRIAPGYKEFSLPNLGISRVDSCTAVTIRRALELRDRASHFPKDFISIS